ncbi:hypothetical protein BUALT_Bualt03G0023200 [Buddleja alternifolia]|uniref:Uncharacterized protein n=1 Tax=Buddleja alternifolia TaxID=168488 RepID=A0AAV6XXA3_9LAMI|nr:hypothetical protein BUALT_Bualt03G0023200 [Buddleja alternifolia]
MQLLIYIYTYIYGVSARQGDPSDLWQRSGGIHHERVLHVPRGETAAIILGLGVGPTIVELDRDRNIHALLLRLSGNRQPVVPAVFIRGKFLGGIETVMTCHNNGTLVPLLKDAGALWL